MSNDNVVLTGLSNYDDHVVSPNINYTKYQNKTQTTTHTKYIIILQHGLLMGFL